MLTIRCVLSSSRTFKSNLCSVTEPLKVKGELCAEKVTAMIRKPSGGLRLRDSLAGFGNVVRFPAGQIGNALLLLFLLDFIQSVDP